MSTQQVKVVSAKPITSGLEQQSQIWKITFSDNKEATIRIPAMESIRHGTQVGDMVRELADYLRVHFASTVFDFQTEDLRASLSTYRPTRS